MLPFVPSKKDMLKAIQRSDNTFVEKRLYNAMLVRWMYSDFIIHPIDQNAYAVLSWPGMVSPLTQAVLNGRLTVYDRLLQYTYQRYSPEYLPVLTALIQKGQSKRMQCLMDSGRISVSYLTAEQFEALLQHVGTYLNEQDFRKRIYSANVSAEHSEGVAMMRMLLRARPGENVNLIGYKMSMEEIASLRSHL